MRVYRFEVLAGTLGRRGLFSSHLKAGHASFANPLVALCDRGCRLPGLTLNCKCGVWAVTDPRDLSAMHDGYKMQAEVMGASWRDVRPLVVAGTMTDAQPVPSSGDRYWMQSHVLLMKGNPVTTVKGTQFVAERGWVGPLTVGTWTKARERRAERKGLNADEPWRRLPFPCDLVDDVVAGAAR